MLHVPQATRPGAGASIGAGAWRRGCWVSSMRGQVENEQGEGVEVMPRQLRTRCRHVGCAELVETAVGYCDKHKREEYKRIDQHRGSARERGYTGRWDKARKTFLLSHPLCAECERNGRVTAATVVDHVVPHKGNQELFWDTSNWQPLCVECHNRKSCSEGAFRG